MVVEGSNGIDQQQLDEIKARYGIGSRAEGPSRFPIVLIEPSHYDDDGYVIQWYRSGAPSKSLAAMTSLVEDCRQRKVLGEQVEIEIRSMDEDNTRIRTQRLARELKDGQGLVILVGVQSNQFPRAMDIALPLRVTGVHVCMGGLHVSGSVSTQGGVTTELQEVMNLGISLFAGEAEGGRLDQVLRDAWSGQLKPLYNYLNDVSSPEGAPTPVLAAKTIRGTIGRHRSFDAERGSRSQFSFCTILHGEGPTSQQRTVDEVEQAIRENLNLGVEKFFITDDDFSRNPDWENIFDRLIAMREQEHLNIEMMLHVDAKCYRLPAFIDKAGRAGVRRVFIELDGIHGEGQPSTEKERNRIAEYRRMFVAWKRAGAIVFAGYTIGWPGDTPDSVRRDIRLMQTELAIDLLEPHCLTALSGPEGHKKLHEAGTLPDPDLNRHDLDDVTTQHATMTAEEWTQVYHDAWREFYTLEHMETVLRRAAATDIPLDNMMALLLWFHFCIMYENIDPLQGGYLRRKHRRDRRPTLEKENWLRFWIGYGSDLIYKHWKMARLYLHFRRFVKRLKRDGDAKGYTDAALTPDADIDTNEPKMTPAYISVAQ
jgi:hypothetical protein